MSSQNLPLHLTGDEKFQIPPDIRVPIHLKGHVYSRIDHAFHGNHILSGHFLTIGPGNGRIAVDIFGSAAPHHTQAGSSANIFRVHQGAVIQSPAFDRARHLPVDLFQDVKEKFLGPVPGHMGGGDSMPIFGQLKKPVFIVVPADGTASTAPPILDVQVALPLRIPGAQKSEAHGAFISGGLVVSLKSRALPSTASVHAYRSRRDQPYLVGTLF